MANSGALRKRKVWLSCLGLIILSVFPAVLAGQCVPANPVASFTYNTDTSLCNGASVTFYSTSSAYQGTAFWDFGGNGNSDTASGDTVTYQFLHSGTSVHQFHVRLLVIDSCGNLDSVSRDFYVTPEFGVDFTYSPNPYGCDSVLMGFNNLSTGSGLSYSWDFGDPGSGSANTSSSANPSHRFDINTQDTFSVKLVVSDTCGNLDSVIRQIIIAPFPSADFQFADSLCSGNLSFTNTSTGTGLSYEWNFGDPASGSSNTSTLTNPSHFFDTTGTGMVSYTVSLRATNAYGCTDILTKTRYVQRGPDNTLLGNFVNCGTGNSHQLIVFNNSSTVSSNAEYIIYWGDTSINIDTLSSFTFDTNVYVGRGAWTLRLKTTDNAGCSREDSTTVFNGSNPSGGLASPGNTTNLCAPDTIGFLPTNYSNNPSGTIYIFTVDDGSASQVFQHPPPDTIYHIFDQSSCGSAGNSHTATLRIENPCGFTSATVTPISVNRPPIADFSINKDTPCVNQDIVNFTETSQMGSHVYFSGVAYSCDTVHLRYWTITPNTYQLVGGTLGTALISSAAGSNGLSVRFLDTGLYTITLNTGFDFFSNPAFPCGNTQMVKQVYVRDTVKASFSVNLNPSNGCVNNIFTPVNKSKGPIQSYRWEVTPNSGFSFTMGNQYSVSPQFRFTEGGVYDLNLKVFGECNDNDTSITIIIREKPEVTLPADTVYCGPQTIDFASLTHAPTIDTNFGSLSAYRWRVFGGSVNFVNGTDSNSLSPQIQFLDTGWHMILFTASNACGASLADTQLVHIKPVPVQSSLSDIEVCPGSLISPGTFTSNPTGATFTWTNSNTSIGLAASGTGSISAYNAPANPGGSLITGVITSTPALNGCVGNPVDFEIRIKPTPLPASLSDIEVCPGDSILVPAFASTPAGAGFTWTNSNDSVGLGVSGNGNIAAWIAPQNLGTSAIIGRIRYTPELNGCTGPADSFEVSIRTRPVLSGLTDTLICPNQSFSYPAFSSIPSGAGFNWYNRDTAIGLSDSGTGNLPTFISTLNETGDTLSATIVVIPNYNVCVGFADSFVLSVRPAPVIQPLSDTTVCPGDSVFIPAFTATPGVAQFTWTNSNTQTGLAASGNGSIAPFTAAANLSGSNRVSQVVVIPTLNSCAGLPDTFSLTLKPSPVPAALSDISVCPGDSVFPAAFGSTPAGAAFVWINRNDSIGLAASGSGNLPNFKASANAGIVSINGRIVYTPTLNQCTGDPDSFMISVKPTPTVVANPDLEFCTWDTIQLTAFESVPGGASFVWTNSNTGIGLGASGSGTPSSWIAPANTSASTVVGQIIVTPTLNSCPGVPDTFDIGIRPQPSADAGIADTLCQGQAAFIGQKPIPGESYSWSSVPNGFSDTVAEVSVSPSVTTLYILTVYDSSTQCRQMDSVGILVNPVIAGNSIGNDQVICAGQTPAPLTGNSATGGNSSFVYRWQQSTDSSTWTDITGATAQNYSPGVLTVNTHYRRVVLSGPCSDTSSVIRVIVLPGIGNNYITGHDSICAFFAPSTIQGSTPTGGNGSYSYTWQQAADSTQSPTVISGATNQDYSPGTQTTTTYYRRLTASGACEVPSNWVMIRVFPKPAASFAASNACYAYSNTFTGTSSISSGSIDTFSWDFGDTSFSSQPNPDHTYTYPGAKAVTLTISSDFGCRDTAQETVYVHPKPVADFDSSNACHGLANVFTDQSQLSSGSIITYRWYFGDGDSSSQSSPTHIYGDTGTYAIRLIVESDSGCTDSFFRTVEVYPKPVAGFIGENVCFGQSTHFTDTSSVGAGNLQSWSWEFGNGDTSTQRHPVQTYGTADTFDVTLYVESDRLCRDTVMGEVIVYPSIGNNTISDDDTICAGASTQVFPGSTPTGGTGSYQYQWQSSTDTVNWTTVGTGQNLPAQSPSVNTWYRRIVTSSPCDTNEQNVSNRVFVLVTQGIGNNYIMGHDSICAFFAPSTIQGSAPTGGNGSYSYTWQQAADSNQSPTVISGATNQDYSPGTQTTTTYYRRLTASGACEVPSNWVMIRVFPKPAASFAASNACYAYSNSFTGTSSISAGSIDTFSWDFGDTSFSSQPNPAHTYAYPGGKSVTLTISSDFGCRDTAQETVYVHPKPVADFDSSNACHGLANVFTDQSQLSSGSIITYRWYFGDGDSSSQSSPTHIYGDTGTYAIRLIVESDSGCTDSFFRTVEVYPKPVAGFIGEDVCFGQSTHFTDTSSVGAGSLNNWSWEFGNGDTSTQRHPVQTYGTADTFDVTLYVESDRLCRDTVMGEVIVYPSIGNNTISDDDTICAGASTQVFPGSTPTGGTGSYQYQWQSSTDTLNWTTVGTGQNLPAQSPSVNTWYRRIVTSSPCDTNEQSVSNRVFVLVTQGIGNNYITGHDSICAFFAPSMIQGSTPTGGNGSYSYTWQQAADSTQSPTVISGAMNQDYSPGTQTTTTYYRRLTASGACEVPSNWVMIRVFPKPAASFAASNACYAYSNSFTETSSISAGSIDTFSWDFGDTSFSSQPNPDHTYAYPGGKSVTLTISSDFGCRDTAQETVYVHPKPVADFDSSNACHGLVNVFTDQSQLSSGSIITYRWYFGDGDSSSQSSPTHIYGDTGTYAIRLIVESDSGCTDSFFRTVEVYPKPVAGFIGEDVCFGQSTHFTDTSSVGAGNLQSWSWEFGNGDTSTQRHPVQTYGTADTFDVTLYVESDRLCRDTVMGEVIVYPSIGNNTISDDDTICAGASTQVFPGSTPTGGTGSYQYQWQSSTDTLNWTTVGTGQNLPAQSPSVNTWYRRIVTSSPCDTNEQSTSNRVLVVVTPGIGNNTITADQVICYGQTPDSLRGSVPTGGNGSFTYQWQQSSNDTNYTDISGAEQVSYLPGSMTDTLWFRRMVYSQACDLLSNTVKVAVKPLPVPGFESQNVCFPENAFFSDTSSINQGSVVARTFYFGDGDSAQVQSPVHLYASAGTYTVKLKVESNFGCIDSISRSFSVYPKPEARIYQVNTCYPFAMDFRDSSLLSSGSLTGWKWRFGDGDSSSSQHPAHNYGADGTYTVEFEVESDRGCRDTTDRQVRVFPKPEPGWSATEVCFPNVTDFTDTSSINTGNLVQWTWDFGDGNISAQQHPSHSYTLAGTYTVKLILRSDSNCYDSLSRNIEVRPLPQVNFSFDTLSCLNTSVPFTNQSSLSHSQVWTFGNGDSDTAFHSSSLYSSIGSYAVKLVTTTVYGCVDSNEKQIRIIAPPVANISLDLDSGCGPLTVSINNNSVNEFPVWSWDLGNGNTFTDTFPPDQVYLPSAFNDTVYYVRLNASNKCGTDNALDSVRVLPVPTAVLRLAVNQGCSPLHLQLFNASYGRPLGYSWDYGDGDTSDNGLGIHTKTFLTGNTDTVYHLTLIARNDCGVDTARDQVLIKPNTVTAFFHTDTTRGCAPLEVNFSDYSIGGNYLYYDFGDGNTSLDANPVHHFQNPGTYTVRQFVDNGCAYDTMSTQVVVVPGITPQFTFNPDPQCLGAGVNFSHTTVGAGAVRWYFGDGDSSDLSAPQHAYDQSGKFYVTLRTISAANGCPASRRDSLTIMPLPGTAFTIPQDNGCPPFNFSALNNTPNGQFYTWHFGDGNTASGSSPGHVYTQTGNYTVKLVSVSAQGCTDSASAPVTIHPVPTAGFGFTYDTECDTPSLVSTQNSSSGATNYLWDFGDGSTSVLNNPQHTYHSFGTFVIRLRAENSFGCMDTLSLPHTVYPVPYAAFSLNPDTGCQPLEVRFQNLSLNTSSYFWDFGDGTTGTADTPVHTYLQSGIFTIRLIATGGGSCADTSDRIDGVEVFPKPQALFTVTQIDNDPVAMGRVRFNNQSVDADYYHWDFGDGHESTVTNPEHRYAYHGAYLVELAVGTVHGCLDTTIAEIPLTFFKGLYVPNAFTPEYGIDEVRKFKPVGTSLKTYHLRIFDTYGNLLWESTELQNGQPSEGWDGRVDGKLLNQDVYVWKVEAEFTDGTKWPGMKDEHGRYRKEGTVTLIR